MLIKAPCGNCGENLEFDAELLGTSIQCPHCEKETLLKKQTPPPRIPAPRKPWSAFKIITTVFVGLIGLVVIVIAAGLAMYFLPLIIHKTHKPELSASRAEITGALGFVLGERLGDQYEINTMDFNGQVSMSYSEVLDSTKTNVAPWGILSVHVNKDRRIYSVSLTSSATGVGDDYYTYKKDVLAELTSKYGQFHEYELDSYSIFNSNDTRDIHISFDNKLQSIYLSYNDRPLTIAARAEGTEHHNSQRKKNGLSDL